MPIKTQINGISVIADGSGYPYCLDLQIGPDYTRVTHKEAFELYLCLENVLRELRLVMDEKSKMEITR